nr:MAG TPA: hypothetical protein [Caudoviricetes sp.]
MFNKYNSAIVLHSSVALFSLNLKTKVLICYI